MNQSRSYRCPKGQSSKAIKTVELWLTAQNFNCQTVSTPGGGTMLQVAKNGGWRNLVGMATALNVQFTEVEGTINVEIGAGKWIDKAVASSVSLFLLWPVAIPAAFGAWEQSNLPKRVFEFIDSQLAV